MLSPRWIKINHFYLFRQPADEDQRPDALLTGGLDLILVPGLAFSKTGDR